MSEGQPDRLPDEHAALDAVSADLRAFAAETPPMPPELITRLDLALEAERTRVHPATVPVSRETSRRRWPRLVLAFTTGIVVLAGVSVGVSALWRGQSADESDSASNPGNADNPELAAPDSASDENSFGAETDEGPKTTDKSSAEIYYSGRDYSRTTLPEVGTSSTVNSSVDTDLKRLSSDETALGACFTAIETRYPGDVAVADFAYFEGAPSIVVRVSQVDGGQRLVAVGADCGLTGADELYATAA
ncbi:hypothetical protein AB0I28_22070 [Phytomonospora sp. NPDC050363]|uniref:hypothetical protein n=1 Tax=Phytomonospora sp. NPDC050363 TaxID=3155642 RepID=UPI0033E59D8D